MPLQSASSAVYWQANAGTADDDDEEATLLEELSRLAKQEEIHRQKYGVRMGEFGHLKGVTAAAAAAPPSRHSQGIGNDGGRGTLITASPFVNNTKTTTEDGESSAGRAPHDRNGSRKRTAEQQQHRSRSIEHAPLDAGDGNDIDYEEFTYNPDAELEDIQADLHAAYQEGQAMYEKIGFGEFGRYMANKRRKLGVQQGAARQNADEEEKSELLKGLRIHINGETEPPAHVLSHLVVLHGGVYVPYLDAKKTSATHIIASNLTPSKRIAFKEYRVVKPSWLMDTLRDKKIKDWRGYREDMAPVRDSDIGIAPAGTQIAQPRLAFAAPAVVKAVASESLAHTASSSSSSTPAKMPAKPRTPTKVNSPRRLPPPTSDPISELHVQGAMAAAAPAVSPNSKSAQPPYAGWYRTESNAKSAELLRDERWRLNETAVNTTEFLDKYYQQSRLHWLSTWKAELKKMVGELSEGREMDLSKKRKTPLKGTEQDGRVVLHVDFDSFFVAASLLSRPELKGRPVVVCHATVGDTSSSSEIASASYEAREFGIRNGMSLGSAKSLCPQVQTVPYDFELYRSISAKFYKILFSHAQELEAVSIDEAYISLPPADKPMASTDLLALAEGIRREILDATGCQTSIGVSHNKLLARLATNRAKPSSSFQIGNNVTPAGDGESIAAFLKDIDVESLPNIGWKRANEIEEKLKQLNSRLKTGHFAKPGSSKAKFNAVTDGQTADEPEFDKVGQLLRFSKNQLKEALGEKTGEMVYNYARGIDARELETESVRKSVSAEVNYGIRFKANDEVKTFCEGLGGEVANRLLNLGYRGRQLTLKVMRRAEHAPIEPPKFLGHGVCDTFNVSKSVELTNDGTTIGRVAWELMQSLACPAEELRGIGLQMQKLELATATANIGGANDNGQARLSFRPVTAHKTAQAQLPASPIVITASSSSPVVLAENQPQTRELRPTRLRKDASYVELSSEEEEDLKLLSQAPQGFVANKPAQTILAGPTVKRAKSGSAPPKPIVIAPTPPAPVPAGPKLASPTRLTDKQLGLLGLDSAFFRACSRESQNEILKECLVQRGESREVQDVLLVAHKAKKGKKKPLYAPVFEEAAANAAKREETRRRLREREERKAKAKSLYRIDTSKHGPVPRFYDFVELDEIRRALGTWIDNVGLDGSPDESEVRALSEYCLNVVSKDPVKNGGLGQDIAKASDILACWHYFIARRAAVANPVGSQKAAGDDWSAAWRTVARSVSEAVERDLGGPLRIAGIICS